MDKDPFGLERDERDERGAVLPRIGMFWGNFGKGHDVWGLNGDILELCRMDRNCCGMLWDGSGWIGMGRDCFESIYTRNGAVQVGAGRCGTTLVINGVVRGGAGWFL